MEAFQVPAIPERIREPLRAALRGESSSWPDVLTGEETRALVEHGVAPLVYAVQPLPDLRGPAIRAAAIEPLRAADLNDVLRELAARDIDTLVTKGTALAYDVYAAPEQRPRGDIDLLVPREQAPAAIAAFRELGFEERLTSGDEHGLRQISLTRTDGHGVRHEYDLHWDIANTPLFSSALRFTELRARSVDLPALGPHARGLERADALLLACIHRVAHHHDSERLIWLVDIALLRDRMSREEHARFWLRAAEARVVGVCRRSVELADDWLSRTPRHRAEEFLSPDEIAREEPSRAFLNRDLTYGGVMAANFRALPWRARLQRLRQLAFPSAAFLRQSYGASSRVALPWLYLRRGARGMRRLFRRVT